MMDRFELWLPLKNYARRILLAVVAVSVVVAGYELLSRRYYVATVTLAPAQNNMTPDSRLQGVASLAGLGVGKSQSQQTFDKFMYLVTSTELAEQLLKKPNIVAFNFPNWDFEHHSWKTDPSFLGVLRSMFGEKPAPTARDLSIILEKNLTVESIPSADSTSITSNLFHLQYRGKTPEEAEQMLQEMLRDSNDILRTHDADIAKVQADYLEEKLSSVTEQAFRQTLLDLYVEQARTLMLASSNAPYAGQTIGVSAPPELERRNVVLITLISAVTTFAVAYFLAIVFHNFRRARNVEHA